jgi:hypothetical protein
MLCNHKKMKSIALASVAACGMFFFFASSAAFADVADNHALSPYPAGPQSALLDQIAPTTGTQVTFSVDPAYDYKNRTSLPATLEFTGQRAYIYVDNEFLSSLATDEQNAFLAQAKDLLAEFDNRIYPIVTGTFGPPWEPGVDNDVRTTVLLTRLTETAAGYFNPRDEFERSAVPESNQREMVYLNTRFLAAGRAKMFLAHEFQHLITFYWKDKLLGEPDDIWLNEARSEYVPTLLGYDTVYNGSNLEHRVNTFLKAPADSLTEWKNSPNDYGPIALFAQYLADQYSANIFREIMHARSVGFVSVEDAAKALGRPASFDDIYQNWTIANYVNDVGVNSAYGYLNPRLRTFKLSPYEISSSTSEAAFTAKDWSNSAYEFYGATGRFTAINIMMQGAVLPFRATFVRTEGGIIKVDEASSAGQKLSFGADLSPMATYIVIPFGTATRTDFKDAEPDRQFLLRVTNDVVDVGPPTAPVPNSAWTPPYPDGSLLRAYGDYKVYVTKGQFKRHIVSPDIFAFYGHFGFAKVIDVPSDVLAQYKLSAWVRADGDTKVWEINGDGTKHWINIPGEQFAPSGRDWNGVYIINTRERDWYKRGADVMK